MRNLFEKSIRGGMACACLAIVGLLSGPAESHHSFAMYDTSERMTLTGRLVRFIPGANHAQLLFEALDASGAAEVDEDGKPIVWGVETGPSAAIARQGVTVKKFALGTVFTVTLSPLRDGRTFGAQAGPIIYCGNELPAAGCNEDSGEVMMNLRFF